MKETVKTCDAETWFSIRSGLVCDRMGEQQATISYTRSNRFSISPHVDYQFLTEDEIEAMRRCEHQRAQHKKRAQETVLATIYDFAAMNFTSTQQAVFFDYLNGKSWIQIGRERGCSEAAVRQVFKGNSRGQGGIIRKLKKHVGHLASRFDSPEDEGDQKCES